MKSTGPECCSLDDGASSVGSARSSDLPALRRVLRRIHRDERGAVTIETILIIGAIALPILIFILKFGWPRIRDYFGGGMERLEIEADRTKNGG